MMYNNVKVPGSRFYEPGVEETSIRPRDQWIDEDPPFDFEEDPEDAALRAIWQEEHDAWEARRAADALDAERARQDAEACRGEDGPFDWDAFQMLCDITTDWD